MMMFHSFLYVYQRVRKSIHRCIWADVTKNAAFYRNNAFSWVVGGMVYPLPMSCIDGTPASPLLVGKLALFRFRTNSIILALSHKHIRICLIIFIFYFLRSCCHPHRCFKSILPFPCLFWRHSHSEAFHFSPWSAQMTSNKWSVDISSPPFLIIVGSFERYIRKEPLYYESFRKSRLNPG